MSGIVVNNVTQHFGDTRALDGVSLTFEPERIYGLLGRNGAGKSTLLNIITNRIFADSGQVTIDGMPARENDDALRKVYLMSEKNYYPESMRIREVFQWTGEFYPEFDMEYALLLAEKFGLNVKKKARELSTGYASIFKVIVALSVNTPYVLLDEPVLGLDANHRDLFYRVLIEKYSEHPSTIVISTHLIEEVSAVIDGIIIIKNGRILKDQSREELLSQGYTVSGSAAAVDRYIQGRNVLGSSAMGGLKSAYIMESCDRKTVPEGLEISPLDLQSLFIQLTNS